MYVMIIISLNLCCGVIRRAVRSLASTSYLYILRLYATMRRILRLAVIGFCQIRSSATHQIYPHFISVAAVIRAPGGKG